MRTIPFLGYADMNVNFLEKSTKIYVASAIAKIIKGKDLSKEDDNCLMAYCSLYYCQTRSHHTDSGYTFLTKIKGKNISLILLKIDPSSFIVVTKYKGKIKKFIYCSIYNKNAFIKDAKRAMKSPSTQKIYIKDNFLLDKIEEFL